MTKIGTAILELRTDTGAFSSGLDQAKGKLRTFSADVDLQSKALANFGKVLAGAFTVTAIAAAAKQFIDFGGEVTDLAAKMKVSTNTVQEWQATFGAAGVSIEEVGRASEQLTVKLIGGDKSAVAALQKMGLSVDALKAMKPEERFTVVADAIGNIQDAGEQLYASKTLMGKGGPELLAALDGHLGESIEKIRAMGLVIDEETLVAADNFGDQLGFLGQQLMGIVAQIVGPLLPALSALGNVLSWLGRNVIGPVLGGAVKGAMTLLAGFVDVITDVLSRIAALGAKLPGVGGKFQELSDYLKGVSTSAREYMKGLWTETADVGQVADVVKPKLLGLGEATAKTSDAAAKAAKAHAAQADALAQLGARIAELNRANAQGIVPGPVYDPAGGDQPDVERLRGVVAVFDRVRDIEGSIGTAGAKGLEQLGKQFELIAPKLSAGFGAFLQRDLGKVILGAVQGGGNVAGAAGAAIGNQVGQGLLGDQAGKGLSGFLTKNLGKTLGGALGSVIPGLGTVLGSLGGGLIGKALGKLFGSEGKEANKLRDQFIGTFESIDVLREKAFTAGISLDNLLNANKPKAMQAAIEELSAALQFQDDAMQVLAETTQRYNFTIDELGPAFARQELDKQAQQLWKDFQVLTSAGIETDTVLGKMGASINQFVADALRTGTEVPAAMAPMLQRMVEMGQLTDENGNVIDDLEKAGVSFSMTMSQGFQSLIGEVKRLTDAISRGLGLAIQNIPQPVIRGRVEWDTGAMPSGAFDAGEGAGGPIPMAAGGFGRVTSPTLFLAGERGPEDFAFSGANKSFAGGDPGVAAVLVEQFGEIKRYFTTQLPRDLARSVRSEAQYITAVA